MRLLGAGIPVSSAGVTCKAGDCLRTRPKTIICGCGLNLDRRCSSPVTGAGFTSGLFPTGRSQILGERHIGGNPS